MNCYNEYVKYKRLYLNLKQKGGHNNKRRKSSRCTLTEPREYQIGILQMYKKDKELSSLNALEIGIGNALDSILLSKQFKSYTGVDSKESSIKKAIENCEKHSCKIDFIHSKMKDLTKDKVYDYILIKNNYHKINDYGKALDTLLDILDDDGVILIDESKSISDSDKLKDLQKYLISEAPKKYNIRVKYFDKKLRDVYSVTKNYATFHQKRKEIPVPPAERWY
jgi:ubiquinone/menaquinone biosynthesis C-methylase UbiE